MLLNLVGSSGRFCILNQNDPTDLFATMLFQHSNYYLRDCPFNYELQARVLLNLDRGNVRGEAHDDDRPYHRLDPAPRVVLRILVIQNRSSAGRHKKNKGFVRFL